MVREALYEEENWSWSCFDERTQAGLVHLQSLQQQEEETKSNQSSSAIILQYLICHFLLFLSLAYN